VLRGRDQSLALKEEASPDLREGTTFSRAVKSFSAYIGTAESRGLLSRQRCCRQTADPSALEGLWNDNLRGTSEGGWVFSMATQTVNKLH